MSDSPQLSPPTNNEPTELYLAFAGWPPEGPNSFKWMNGRLHYGVYLNRGRETYDAEVIPPNSSWKRLWEVCDQIDIWSWPKAGFEGHGYDELQFVIRLQVGQRKIGGLGWVRDTPETEKKVMRFLEELQGLTEWRKTETGWAKLNSPDGIK
jgi:hypothetical protein